jgi:putative Mg2+ transporter-C (MgtC) family protein
VFSSLSSYFLDLWNAHSELYFRLLMSVIFGLFIGFERAIKQKPAGIRTHILVCLGSCLIMVVSTLNEGAYKDPMRLAAQVVSGIGFIGAGVIWKDRSNTKRGITTAANLWITACLGLTIGFGKYDIAIVTGILMYVAMNLPTWIEKIGILPARNTDHSDGDSDGE